MNTEKAYLKAYKLLNKAYHMPRLHFKPGSQNRLETTFNSKGSRLERRAYRILTKLGN